MDSNMMNAIKSYMQKQSYIEFAYVFGSYARGDYLVTSDIDIAISLSIEKLLPQEYLKLRTKLMEITKKEIDIIILNDADTLIKHRITQEGILIFTRSEVKEKSFRVRVLFEYDDMKKYLELSYSAMIDRVRKELDNGSRRSN